MSQPVISVVITTYNYGQFIEESIESVLSQDFPREQMEIVVVDDGSTDDTAERMKKYGEKVRYFRTENRGQAAALNLGFAKSRGEIISLLDADDFFFPGKLVLVAEAFQRDSALGMVYHPMQGWDAQTDERRATPYPLLSGSALEKKEFFWYEAPGTCASFRREFLDRFLPIPEEIRMLADDYPGCLIVFVAPVLALPECLSAYRVHGKNSFQTDETRMPRETRERKLHLWQVVTDAKRKWLSEHGFTRKQPAVRSALDRWTLHLQKQEFLVEPPGRLRYFSHLLLYNRCYGPHLSRRLRLVNRINALGALIVGYKHFPLLEKWRLALVGGLKRAIRTTEERIL
jgi:glycosyltransferase involved in cell wall biosynthesis